MEVQTRNVPHFKVLISGNLELTDQGRDSTSTFRHFTGEKGKSCMYSSTGLVNQIILDALADWAVQAGRNQINQIFVKYPRFSSNKFIFLTLKPQI